jgi:hypothetical protein
MRVVTLINIVTQFISQHIVLLFDPSGYFAASPSRPPPSVPRLPYSATVTERQQVHNFPRRNRTRNSPYRRHNYHMSATPRPYFGMMNYNPVRSHSPTYSLSHTEFGSRVTRSCPDFPINDNLSSAYFVPGQTSSNEPFQVLGRNRTLPYGAFGVLPRDATGDSSESSSDSSDSDTIYDNSWNSRQAVINRVLANRRRYNVDLIPPSRDSIAVHSFTDHRGVMIHNARIINRTVNLPDTSRRSSDIESTGLERIYLANRPYSPTNDSSNDLDSEAAERTQALRRVRNAHQANQRRGEPLQPSPHSTTYPENHPLPAGDVDSTDLDETTNQSSFFRGRVRFDGGQVDNSRFSARHAANQAGES